VQRLLPLARFQEVIQSFGAKRWINEQLSRPPLLNLTAENDVDFRRRQRTGFGKEEAPRHLVLETVEDQSVTFVPGQTSPGVLSVFLHDRDLVPDRTMTNDFNQFGRRRSRSIFAAGEC